VWQLASSDRTIALLVVTGSDFPWLHSRVEPQDGFDDVRPIFEDELRLLDDLDDQIPAWEAMYQQIRRTVSLIKPDGRAVPEFLLHIDGREARWRWSDTPFQ
jgi:hypothetical protein